jgi:hypothetical protein
VPEKTCVGKTGAGVKAKYDGTVFTVMSVVLKGAFAVSRMRG